MALVSVETIPLPEVALDDPRAVQERFLQLVALGIPGFVICNAGVYPFFHERVDRMVAPVLEFDNLVRDFTFEVPGKNKDLDPHIDTHPGHGRLQLNEYSVVRGVVSASLFRLHPHTAQEIVTMGEMYRYLFGRAPVGNTELTIDDELAIPIAHSAKLQQGDVLYFTDSRHAHYFKTEESPRLATATLYPLRLPDNVFTDLSLRRVLEQSAEHNPQAYIFPEVRSELQREAAAA